MGVVIVNPDIQEVEGLRNKQRFVKDEEERKVISKELDIAKTKSQLANSRWVRQRNLMW